MLPWLFGVLLVLNLVLFYWGFQHRQSPQELPPVPEGQYEIRLSSEVSREDTERVPATDKKGAAPQVPGSSVVQDHGGAADAVPAEPLASEAASVTESVPAAGELGMSGEEAPSPQSGTARSDTVSAEQEPRAQDDGPLENQTAPGDAPGGEISDEMTSDTVPDEETARGEGDERSLNDEPREPEPEPEVGVSTPRPAGQDAEEAEPPGEQTEETDTLLGEPAALKSAPEQTPEGGQ